MLSLLADGLRETADYRVFEKRYTFKLLLSYYDAATSDLSTQVSDQSTTLRLQICFLQILSWGSIKKTLEIFL